MNISAAHLALLTRPLTAVLSTIGSDGRAQSAPIWYLLEEGRLKLSTTDESLKVRNVARDPRVSLTVFDPDHPLSYVEIRGSASVEPDVDNANLHRLAQHYGYRDGSAFLRPGTTRVVVTLDHARAFGQ